MRTLKQFHSAEKVERGEPFRLFETSVCCKISKNLKGDPLATKHRKKSLSAEKKFKGGTLLSRPVLYPMLKME